MTKTKQTQACDLAGVKWRSRKLPIGSLAVDSRLQRAAPSKKLVLEIVNNFVPAAVGTLHVSVRDDGLHHLVDGQRRWLALQQLYKSNHLVDCQLYENLSRGQEAALFRYLNRQRITSAWDDFDKGLIQGDRDCVEIDTICSNHNWRITQSHTTSGVVSCVAAMRTVVRRFGSDTLNRVFYVLTTAWGHDQYAPSSTILTGLAQALNKDASLSLDKLAEKLSASYTPLRLIQAAKYRSTTERGSLASMVTALVLTCYSKRIRKA